MAAGASAWDSVFRIAPGEAVQIVRSGKQNRIETQPGIHLKIPFVEKLLPMPEAHPFERQEICLTQDKKKLPLNLKIIWEIDDMAVFSRTTGGVQRAQMRIDDFLSAYLRNHIATAHPDQIERLQRIGTLKLMNTEQTSHDHPLYGLIDEVNRRLSAFGININALQVTLGVSTP